MAEESAEQTLRTIISWGRYAETFAYDDQRQVFSLENRLERTPRGGRRPHASSHRRRRSRALLHAGGVSGPEGFTTETAGTGSAALERVGRGALDLVVLDVMLPELSGFEVLRRLRSVSRIPVIMLTARGEEVDRVIGLELGADDDLAKPFSPWELVARIRAVLRRMAAEPQPVAGAVELGAVTARSARQAGGSRRGGPRTHAAELRILELLMRADTRTVSREDLMLQALGRRLLPTDRSLDTHVSNLRRKLAKLTDRVAVQSVRGSGYALTVKTG